MKILGIDTTAKTASCAVAQDGVILGTYTQQSGITHSETMLPMINALLTNLHLNTDDIDVFAVSAGPGSFTGVRIGVSLIKGLAFGKNKPCVPVSTLYSLALNLDGISDTPHIVCPVMDARRSQLYNALFLYKDGKTERLTPDRLIASSDLVSELGGYGYDIYFCGDGCYITDTLTVPNKKNCPASLRNQSGASVCIAAGELYLNTDDKSVFSDVLLKPDYLRPSQAERELIKKEK